MTTFVFPGQGSQFKGMGQSLFKTFGDLTAAADAQLGYSVEQLCVTDRSAQLGQTQYTQPALYVVNALSYLQHSAQCKPDFVAGHSLGEYSALFAAGAVDFETGLKLVQKRGALMSKASGGAMAAVIGLDAGRVRAVIEDNNLSAIDIANYNAPSQLVIAGPCDHLAHAQPIFEAAGAKWIRLKVSAAFHSRGMQTARDEFASWLEKVEFCDPAIPVISNVDARPHETGKIAQSLARQITHPVRWTDSIRYLLGHGETDFKELGPGKVLTSLIEKIRSEEKPRIWPGVDRCPGARHKKVNGARVFEVTPDSLGSESFRRNFNLKYAYVAGSMYKGIASEELVVRMGKAGLLGYFGTGGLKPGRIEKAIRHIQSELDERQAYGMNLLCNIDKPEDEDDIVELFFKHQVRNIEAAGFMEITPALARFRLRGLRQVAEGGAVLCPNRVLAKVSRPEVAAAFLSPAPERVVERLLRQGKITEHEAVLSKRMPMADALCAEADSGGHTDQGVAATLIPTLCRMRDEFVSRHGYQNDIVVGAAGGIGTPESAASAFVLGADFVLTGSINQCTPQAGNSEPVKGLLQCMDIQDTDYAPAGDMFELGAKVQVLKKGLFFPARAKRLYELYRQHESVDELDHRTRQELESKYFKRGLEEVYRETKAYYLKHDPRQIERAEVDAKHKMSLIFRWYFVHTMRLALQGSVEQRVDYQVHCGPAMGAFNRWVKGTDLEDWRNRHVEVIAERLMCATAELLNQRLRSLCGMQQTLEELAD